MWSHGDEHLLHILVSMREQKNNDVVSIHIWTTTWMNNEKLQLSVSANDHMRWKEDSCMCSPFFVVFYFEYLSFLLGLSWLQPLQCCQTNKFDMYVEFLLLKNIFLEKKGYIFAKLQLKPLTSILRDEKPLW